MPFILLQIGTSSAVYPAAGFAPALAARGVNVAEFNMEETDATTQLRLVFLFEHLLLVNVILYICFMSLVNVISVFLMVWGIDAYKHFLICLNVAGITFKD